MAHPALMDFDGMFSTRTAVFEDRVECSEFTLRVDNRARHCFLHEWNVQIDCWHSVSRLSELDNSRVVRN